MPEASSRVEPDSSSATLDIVFLLLKGAGLAFVMFLVIRGLDTLPVWKRAAPPAAEEKQKDDFAALALAPRALPHPNEELDIFDVAMRPTTVISRRADQRPIYLVTGRIKNRTLYQVDEVWIDLNIYDTATGGMVDSAVVKLEDLGLSGNDGVISFSRTVQVLPPPKWGFNYDILQAKSEPVFSDTNFDIGIQSSK
jgi:hypothetical protein